MSAKHVEYADSFRLPLVRVAARLNRRDGSKARALTGCIVKTLADAGAQAEAAGRGADGHLFDFHGRPMRATPQVVAYLHLLGTLMDLYSLVRGTLEADAELADLLPLIPGLPRPRKRL